jgi:glutathione S-transferase
MAAEHKSDASASPKGFARVYLLLLVFCLSATACHEDNIASFRTFEACDNQAVKYLAGQDLYDDQGGKLAGLICRWVDSQETEARSNRSHAMPDTLKLYHAVNSPNSRRVRIFLAEKGLKPTLISVDLGASEQHTEAYRAINPRRVVPALVLEDGTTIGEVPAIMRYLDESFPKTPLLGATPRDKGLIVMWERFAELEGFAPVMEGVRNKAERLKGRAIAGPHGYEQIPGLVDRGVLRVKNFLNDLNVRLEQVPFVAGEQFSAADITALVTIDFAKALDISVPAEHRALMRWKDLVSARPSTNA